jgi:DnaJ-class molecular chaperone
MMRERRVLCVPCDGNGTVLDEYAFAGGTVELECATCGGVGAVIEQRDMTTGRYTIHRTPEAASWFTRTGRR